MSDVDVRIRISADTGQMTVQLRDAKGEVREFSDELGNVGPVADRSFKQVDQASKSTAGSLREVSEAMRDLGRDIMEVGRAVSFGVSLPLGAAGGLAAKFALDYQNAVNQVVRQTGLANGAIDGMRASIGRVHREVPQRLGEVANVMGVLAVRTGLTGTALEDLSIATLDFSRVIGDDATRSANNLGRVMAALDLNSRQASQAMDLVAFAAQRSGIQANALFEMVVEAGPAFVEMGFGLERSVALFAQFEKFGARPQELLSSMNIVMSRMAERGLTDVRQGFEDLIASIEDAPTLLDGVRIAVENFGARVGPKVAEDIQAGRFEIEEFLKVLQGAPGTVGRMADEATDFTDVLSKLQAELELALIPVGEKLVEMIRDLVPHLVSAAEVLAKLVEAFADLPEVIQVSTLAIGGLLVVTGPLLLGVGGLITGLGGFARALTFLSPHVKAVRAALQLKTASIVLATNGTAAYTTKVTAATLVSNAFHAALIKLRAALAFLLGPIGIIGTLAITGAVLLRRYSKRVEELGEQSELTAESLAALQETAALGWPTDRINEVTRAIRNLREEADALEASLKKASRIQFMFEAAAGMPGLGGFVQAGMDWFGHTPQEFGAISSDVSGAIASDREIARFAEHRAGIKHHEDFAAALDMVSAASDFLGPKLRDLAERFGLTSEAAREAKRQAQEITEELSRLRTEVDGQIKQLEHQIATFGMSRAETVRYNAEILAAQIAAAGLRDETGALIEEDQKRINQLRDSAALLAGTIEHEEEVARAIAEHKREAEEAANALSAMAQTYHALLASVDPVAAAHRTLSTQLEDMIALSELSSDALEEQGINAELLAKTIAHLKDELDDLAGVPKVVVKGFDDIRRSILAEIEALEGGAEAWREFQRAMFISQAVSMLPEGATDEMKREIEELAGELFDLQEKAQIEFEIEGLQDSFHQLSRVMRQLESDIALIDEALNAGVLNGAEAGMLRIGTAASAAFGAMMQGVDRTSKEYAKLERAQQITNVAMGIAAILQQGMGDPYTAIPRMIAMAALVASLGVKTGSVGGGSAAQQNQEAQGTGSVLGDAEAKSDTIARATQIAADATRELVGINRAQLRALVAMQRAIAGASGMVARGAGEIDFSEINAGISGLERAVYALDPLGPIGNAFWSAVGSLFGFGKTKVVDQGIALLGGMITEMTEGAVAQAFGEVRRKSLFGSKRATGFEDLDDTFNTQLNLIFQSMIDTVTAAGEALGIPLDDLEARIASFEVEAQKISLMDLTAEEAQAELEAVFSQIFDGLAGHVVPFIAQFQQVGEGLGATLVRVATGVQVTEEAIRRLGFQAERTGPEQFAQLSERLIEFAGGLDEFISGIGNFFDKFASDSQKFEVAQDSITRAFEQFGLVVPETREGMAALMQTLDATTEAGAEQIAILLQLADAADAYYKQLEAVQNEREGLERKILRLEGDIVALRQLEIDALDESNRHLQERIFALEDEAELAAMMKRVTDDIASLSMSPLRDEARKLQVDFNNLIKRARELGASEQQLETIRRRHQLQINALVAQLKASLLSIVEQLSGSSDTGIGGQFDDGFADSIGRAANRIRDQLIRALEGVEAWLVKSELTDASMTSVQRFHAVNDRFAELMDQVMSGDPEAAAKAAAELPGMADELLALAGQMYGTATPEYQEFLAMVRSQMAAAAGIEVPDEVPPTGAQVGAIQTAVEHMRLTAVEQAELAGRFIEELGAVAHLLGRTPFDIADELNLPLREMIERLVDLQDPTVETVHQLAMVANILGVSLPALADELGLAIGDLRDESSLLSMALQDVVASLPDEIQEELAGHLAAIAGATTEADANAAIAELEEAVNALDPAFRNALSPFLEGVSIVDPLMDTLGVLEQIREYDRRQMEAAEASTGILQEIMRAVRAQNQAEGIPGFASGGWASGVIRTGEEGPELVLPHDVSSFFARSGIPVNVAGGMDDRRIVGKLQELLEVERRAFEQRERLGGQQIEVVRDLSGAMIDAERRRASERGLMA